MNKLELKFKKSKFCLKNQKKFKLKILKSKF